LLSVHEKFSAAEKHFEDLVQPPFLKSGGLLFSLRLLKMKLEIAVHHRHNIILRKIGF
jgi:hypothetical protein